MTHRDAMKMATANNGLMRRSRRHLYSITSPVRASSIEMYENRPTDVEPR